LQLVSGQIDLYEKIRGIKVEHSLAHFVRSFIDMIQMVRIRSFTSVHSLEIWESSWEANWRIRGKML